MPPGMNIATAVPQTTVARSTFEERLRTAENKRVTNVGQFVRLVLGSGPEEDLGVVTTNSSQPARSD